MALSGDADDGSAALFCQRPRARGTTRSRVEWAAPVEAAPRPPGTARAAPAAPAGERLGTDNALPGSDLDCPAGQNSASAGRKAGSAAWPGCLCAACRGRRFGAFCPCRRCHWSADPAAPGFRPHGSVRVDIRRPTALGTARRHSMRRHHAKIDGIGDLLSDVACAFTGPRRRAGALRTTRGRSRGATSGADQGTGVRARR